VTIEFLGRHEVLQVLVVHPDLYRVSGFFQEVSLLLQCVDDSEHLLVVDLVVPFHRRQGFAVDVMNIEWDYSYYQPWSDNEWLVEEMIAMRCYAAREFSAEM